MSIVEIFGIFGTSNKAGYDRSDSCSDLKYRHAGFSEGLAMKINEVRGKVLTEMDVNKRDIKGGEQWARGPEVWTEVGPATFGRAKAQSGVGGVKVPIRLRACICSHSVRQPDPSPTSRRLKVLELHSMKKMGN